MKTQNPIEEVWRSRDELLAEHGGNFDEYFNWLMREQEKHGERLVRPHAKEQPGIEQTAALREEPPPYGKKTDGTK
jgi:hypothetical protein